jgi:hypothetical protein
VTGKCFRLIGEQLQRLVISGCDKILDGGFEELFTRNGQNIRELVTGPTPSSILTGICSNLKVLKRLEVTPTEAEARGFSEICRLKRLEELKVFKYFVDCDDEGLLRVLRACPQLRLLHISDASNITNESVREISEHCPLLEDLMLSKSKLTDTGIESIGSLTRIRKLDVSQSQVTDDGVKFVVQFCSRLEFLNINFCNNTTTDPIAVAIQGAADNPQLGKLVFMFCGRRLRVSDTDLKELDALVEEDEYFPELMAHISEAEEEEEAQDSVSDHFLEEDDPLEEEEREWMS